MTHDRTYIGTIKQLLKWKKKLSERQAKNILKVVHWFGLDFYSENSELEYDALKIAGHHFKQTSLKKILPYLQSYSQFTIYANNNQFSFTLRLKEFSLSYNT